MTTAKMLRPLVRGYKPLHHFVDGREIEGPNPGLSGNCTDLRGDCTGLSGNCTGLSGSCTGLRGDCTDIPLSSRPARISDFVRGE